MAPGSQPLILSRGMFDKVADVEGTAKACQVWLHVATCQLEQDVGHGGS